MGKLGGLYPEQPLDALAVDEVMDVVQDALTRTPQDADADVKKAKREEYAAGKLKGYMALLAHRYQSTDGGPYLLGTSLTVADLALYYLLAMLRRCVSVRVCVLVRSTFAKHRLAPVDVHRLSPLTDRAMWG